MKRPSSLIHDGAVSETAGIAKGAPEGCFVEVGVYKGGMAYALAEVAREQGRELHLFDTFTGIPFQDPGDNHKAGDFGDVVLADVQAAIPDAHFHVGVFPGTMPKDMPPVAFVHCDVDQHESVRAVINEFWPRLVVGGVMAFDDMNQTAARALIEKTFGERLQEQMGVWHVRKDA